MPPPLEGGKAVTAGATVAAAGTGGGESDAVDVERRGEHSVLCRWRVRGFSKVRARALWSRYFAVGGYDCRLLVYPKGDSQALPGYLSIYLQVKLPPLSPRDVGGDGAHARGGRLHTRRRLAGGRGTDERRARCCLGTPGTPSRMACTHACPTQAATVAARHPRATRRCTRPAAAMVWRGACLHTQRRRKRLRVLGAIHLRCTWGPLTTREAHTTPRTCTLAINAATPQHLFLERVTAGGRSAGGGWASVSACAEELHSQRKLCTRHSIRTNTLPVPPAAPRDDAGSDFVGVGVCIESAWHGRGHHFTERLYALNTGVGWDALQVADPRGASSPKWDCFASYKLAVMNQRDDAKSVARDSWHRFSSKKKSHGWCVSAHRHLPAAFGSTRVLTVGAISKRMNEPGSSSVSSRWPIWRLTTTYGPTAN